MSGQIDFFSYIGPSCPICGSLDCYREITPYFRYAIEFFPKFKKKRIPIARFLCRKRRGSFSLLPIQLIPYLQYTVAAVVGALLLGYGYWQRGQRGFWGAVVAVDAVDPDSLVTPWLIVCWLKVIVLGFRRAHAVLRRFCDLSGVHTSNRNVAWEEVGGYFVAFGLKPHRQWWSLLSALLSRYSLATTQFLFGTASQLRGSACH